ncbi:MAG: glycoside hydrolase family 27 protein [Lachnospiraceae bacterium]|nr:glycoside hydrolase family 27 protein [Lachnospiraceae bacterium]
MRETMICPTPPMGWNSWNTFYDKINESLIRETADAIVESGLKDAGYEYLIIDDCWSMKERDAQGNLVPDPEKFPGGIKAAADYVHEKGLKFGIYSCCGTRTCAGYPGSFEHEFQDAAQFAEWGVDYLKYDNCSRPRSQGTEMLYRRMSMALRSTGRDIVLAACQWGTENVHRWIRSTGAHTFRSTVDIQDSWNSIETIVSSQLELQAFGSADCFNDMDMLVVGMNGGGFNPETKMGGCTEAEYQTHFALWAMMNSPLIIGCDVRELSKEAGNILMNADLIAINQDSECRSAYQVDVYESPDSFILVKPLSNNEYAVGYFNFGDSKANVTLNFWDMGLSSAAGYGMDVYDCLDHQSIGIKREYMTVQIPAHGCRIVRMKPKGMS